MNTTADFMENADNVYRTREYIVRQIIGVNFDAEMDNNIFQSRHVLCAHARKGQTVRSNLCQAVQYKRSAHAQYNVFEKYVE